MQEDITAEQLAPYLLRHPDLVFPHRHSFYHLVYFSQGAGSFTIDFEQFDIAPGLLYFMVPGQVHTWDFEPGIDGYIVNFSEQLLQSFFQQGHHLDQFPFFSGTATEGVVTLGPEASHAATLLGQLAAEVAGGGHYSRQLITAQLMWLLVLAARVAQPQHAHPAIQQQAIVLHHFRRLVEQHYAYKRLPKEYAAMLYITPNHLNALCQDLLGKQAGVVIRDRVLLEAKRMLASGGMSVAEIAGLLHFEDNSYFGRFFKKYTGSTPEDFRKGVAVKNIK